MQVGEIQLRGRREQVLEGLAGVVIMQVIKAVVGTDAHAHARAALHAGHCLQHFQHETQAIFQAAAVGVVAGVRAGAQKLRWQITAGAVQFHGVEARLEGIHGGAAILFDNAGDLIQPERARRIERLHTPLIGEYLALRGDGGGRHGLATRWLVQCARHAPHVHDLRGNTAAPRMHRRGDGAPGANLLRAVETGGATVAEAIGARRDSLGYDQAGAGTLAVVIHHDIRGHPIDTGTGAGHRRHHHTIAQRQRTQRYGRENIH